MLLAILGCKRNVDNGKPITLYKTELTGKFQVRNLIINQQPFGVSTLSPNESLYFTLEVVDEFGLLGETDPADAPYILQAQLSCDPQVVCRLTRMGKEKAGAQVFQGSVPGVSAGDYILAIVLKESRPEVESGAFILHTLRSYPLIVESEGVR
jgi:hypothetical protein